VDNSGLGPHDGARAREDRGRTAPLATLLRTYCVGHARFLDWCLSELAGLTSDVELVSTTSLAIARVVAEYIDQTSEDVVAYEKERQNWLRNRQLLRQPTLILAGDDDPIIPLVNARLMHLLIRRSELHVYHGGHFDLVSESGRMAPSWRHFSPRGRVRRREHRRPAGRAR
jgi:pimeloyl-ACP methyl ester carboxylesterase